MCYRAHRRPPTRLMRATRVTTVPCVRRRLSGGRRSPLCMSRQSSPNTKIIMARQTRMGTTMRQVRVSSPLFAPSRSLLRSPPARPPLVRDPDGSQANSLSHHTRIVQQTQAHTHTPDIHILALFNHTARLPLCCVCVVGFEFAARETQSKSNNNRRMESMKSALHTNQLHTRQRDATRATCHRVS